MRRLGIGLLLLCSMSAVAAPPPPNSGELSPALQQIVDRIIGREHELMVALKSFSPVAESTSTSACGAKATTSRQLF